MGIKGVFEYGTPYGKSNRDNWLVQVPTIPMVLKEVSDGDDDDSVESDDSNDEAEVEEESDDDDDNLPTAPTYLTHSLNKDNYVVILCRW